MSEENDQVEEQEVDSQAIEDRSKIVGRDGAYLEIDAKNLVSTYKSGELDKAVMIVLTSARIELSDPLVVASMKDKTKDAISSGECEGMTDEQIGFYVVLNALVSGLKK